MLQKGENIVMYEELIDTLWNVNTGISSADTVAITN